MSSPSWPAFPGAVFTAALAHFVAPPASLPEGAGRNRNAQARRPVPRPARASTDPWMCQVRLMFLALKNRIEDWPMKLDPVSDPRNQETRATVSKHKAMSHERLTLKDAELRRNRRESRSHRRSSRTRRGHRARQWRARVTSDRGIEQAEGGWKGHRRTPDAAPLRGHRCEHFMRPTTENRGRSCRREPVGQRGARKEACTARRVVE